MKKILMVLGLMVLGLLIAISCIAAAKQPLQKLTVLLDWFPNPDHAPLIIAQQQGFFRDLGLNVELIGPSDSTDVPKLVAAGKADIGITYEPDYLQQVDAGLPLMCIGTLIDKPLNSLIALKSNGIETLADLKGKRIGASSGNGLSNMMLRVMLSKAGLTDKDVEITNVKYNLSQALLTHKVDAVADVMRNYEVPILESRHQKIMTFFPEDHGVPTYSELVFVSHLKNIHDPRFPRFLAGIKKAIYYLDTHPHQTWRRFAKQYPESNNAVNRQAWFSTMPYFSEDPSRFNPAEWKSFALFMQQNQLIKKIQPTERYAVVLR